MKKILILLKIASTIVVCGGYLSFFFILSHINAQKKQKNAQKVNKMFAIVNMVWHYNKTTNKWS